MITLATRSNLLTLFRAGQRAGINCDAILCAERIAPVNVHSHGRVIDSMIDDLEIALEAAKAFRLEVQGR